MRLYLDEDSFDVVLMQSLKAAGHDVVAPQEFGVRGATDPIQMTKAIIESRVFLTRNHDDFVELNELIVASGGHHPGILVVRSDNDPTRDMTPRGVVLAI